MEKLRELRISRGLTTTELGKIIGCSNPTITNYELGNRKPDPETLIKLANFFDVTVDYLLGREEKNSATNGGDNELNIPEKYKDILVALNNGNENLEQSDIDVIAKFIEFTANKKNKK